MLNMLLHELSCSLVVKLSWSILQKAHEMVVLGGGGGGGIFGSKEK